MNTALMPMPRLQFSDADGVPLAGGFVFTYAAGTTTPQATYQDSTGSAANTNPVVLDGGGFGNIWLAALTYKIVVQDLNGVVQWTADQVSAVSLAELLGNSSFTTIAVSGDATIGGDATVAGTVTASSLEVTGTATVAGNLTAVTAAITGNAAVGGALDVAGALTADAGATVTGALAVSGATSTNTLTVGGVDIDALITSLIPALTVLAGTLVVSDLSTSGNWVILTFGGTSGTRIRIAVGTGTAAANGSTITLPSGFSVSQLKAHATIDAVVATPGNELLQFSVSITAGVIAVAAADSIGHNFTPTASWIGFAWIVNF